MADPNPEELARDAKVVLRWMIDGVEVLPDSWDAGWFMVGAATNLAKTLLRTARAVTPEDSSAMLMAGSLLLACVRRQADADTQARALLDNLIENRATKSGERP